MTHIHSTNASGCPYVRMNLCTRVCVLIYVFDYICVIVLCIHVGKHTQTNSAAAVAARLVPSPQAASPLTEAAGARGSMTLKVSLVLKETKI